MLYMEKKVVVIFQLFSVPLPQMYKIQHIAMQSGFTTICERMICSTELTGCNFFPPSIVNDNIAKEKFLRTTTTQRQRVRPLELQSGVTECWDA